VLSNIVNHKSVKMCNKTNLVGFSPFIVGRYHSLVIEKDTFPSDELEVTAWTEDGLVMAARHRKYKHIQVKPAQVCTVILLPPPFKTELLKSCKHCSQGVQFHPESIITTEGKTIVRNFIKIVEKKDSEKLT